MKIFKRTLLLLLVTIILVVFFNYPKLNILAGYSAKNTASSVFLANRSIEFTDKTDNNFSPVNLATDIVDENKKVASSSVFNLLTRKAINREGLGSVLTINEADETADYLKPKRTKPNNLTPYPYGNAPQKDTIFTNVNYNKLNETIASVFGKNQSRAVVVI